MNRKRTGFRALKAAGKIALVSSSIALLGTLPARAAVLSVGPSNPPAGSTVCADVSEPPLTNGTCLSPGNPVDAFDCNAGPNQQFQIIGVTIYTEGGQLCLDVKGGGTAPGTPVDSYTCKGTPNQQWYYYDGEIISLNGADLCLDASAGLTKQLEINTCNGSSSQNWQIK
jgi:hypothetical protein